MIGWSPALANGVFLYNRLLWIAVGVAIAGNSVGIVSDVGGGPHRPLAGPQRRQSEATGDAGGAAGSFRVGARLPVVHQAFGSANTFAQYVSLTRLRLRNILRDIPYWAIVALLVALGINNGYFAGRFAERNVWPVTYLMLQAVEGNATLFLYIVATLYAAELLWRERDTRFNGIHDALPMRESTDWLSRFSAIVIIELILLTIAMLVGILMQTVPVTTTTSWRSISKSCIS